MTINYDGLLLRLTSIGGAYLAFGSYAAGMVCFAWVGTHILYLAIASFKGR